ncbi:MAG: hypothetical protein ACKOFZ_05280 [Ilumatobacteraceae bacterium]
MKPTSNVQLLLRIGTEATDSVSDAGDRYCANLLGLRFRLSS